MYREACLLWLDPRVEDEENLFVYTNLSNAWGKVERFTSLAGLQARMKDDEKYFVICCSSLSDETYHYLDSQSNIVHLFLYCHSLSNGKTKMAMFNKIEKIFTRSIPLIRAVKSLKLQNS